jgi:hypothetical protein
MYTFSFTNTGPALFRGDTGTGDNGGIVDPFLLCISVRWVISRGLILMFKALV